MTRASPPVAAIALVAASALVVARARAEEPRPDEARSGSAPRAAEDAPRAPTDDDELDALEDEELPSFGASVQVARLGVEDVDASASATTIALTDRGRALETLDEALRDVPGARARRTSSYGGFTALSLRGAEAEHTSVLVGDLPLVAADGSAADLSTLPPWMFERVEVYRGGAPLLLGSSAIGGVVRLVPRAVRERRFELTLGEGSFERHEARISAAVGGSELAVHAGAGVVSAANTFPYRDDGGTAFDPSDDRDRERQNAQLLEGSGVLHLDARWLGGRVGALVTALERTGGLAPSPARFVDDPVGRRAMARYAGALSASWVEGGRDPERAQGAAWRVSTSVGVGVEQRRASDPLAQFGQVPREPRDELVRVDARASAEVAIVDGLVLAGIVSYAHEGLESRDRLLEALAPERARTASRRDQVAIGLEPRLAFGGDDVRFEGRIAGRVEGSFAALEDASFERALGARTVELALPTGRLSVLVELARVLSLVASASAGTRAPSSLELFGDRGYLAGNAALRPETSIAGDVGAVVAGRTEGLRGRAEVRGFLTRVEDLIRYQRITTNQAVPMNVLGAELAGLEAGVSADLLAHLRVDGALTLLDARDTTTGVALPLRPSVVASARVEGYVREVGALSSGRLWIELEHVGASTADPAGLVTIPERTTLGVGVSASFVGERVRLDVLVRDVLDARGYDVLGLPLPGRSVGVQLTLAAD